MPLPNLTDEFIADAYRGVLHTSNVPLTGTTPVDVYDGLGNRSALGLGGFNNGSIFYGTLSARGFVSIGGEDDAPTEFTILVDHIYPVGSVFFSVDDVNPGVRFTGTTWNRVANGKFIASVGTGVDKNSFSQTLSAGNDLTVGEYQHTLTISELAAHNHRPLMRFMSVDDDNADTTGFLGTSFRSLRDINKFGDALTNFRTGDTVPRPTMQITSTGNDQPHNTTPPYFGMYVWQRTS